MPMNIALNKIQIKATSQTPQQIYCSFNFPQLQIGPVQIISNIKSYIFEPIQKIKHHQKISQDVNNCTSIKVSVWKYQPHQLITERQFDFSQIFFSNRRNINIDNQWKIKFQVVNQNNYDDSTKIWNKAKNFQQGIQTVPRAVPKVKSNADLLKKVIQNVSNIPKVMENSQKTNRTQRKQRSRQQNSIKSNTHQSISLIKRSLKNSISQLKNISKKYSTDSTYRQKNDYEISQTKILTNHQSKTLNRSDLKSFYDSCLSQVQKQQCKKMTSGQISQAILSQYGLSMSNLNQIISQNTSNKPQKLSLKKEVGQPILQNFSKYKKQKQVVNFSQAQKDKKLQNSKKIKKSLTDRNQNKNTMNKQPKQSKPSYQPNKQIDKLLKNEVKVKQKNKKVIKNKLATKYLNDIV